MPNETRSMNVAIGCFAVVVLLVGVLITYWPAHPVLSPSAPTTPTYVLIPPVVIERPTVRTSDVLPLIAQRWIEKHCETNLAAARCYPVIKTRRAASCDAECAAYRKAYANARTANALLGEHRYQEHA